ncbi:hypothetical protein GCM10027051_31180 [Niabella terrae]
MPTDPKSINKVDPSKFWMWAIVTLCAAVSVVFVSIIQSKNSEISRLTKQNDEYRYILIPQLQQVQKLSQQAAQAYDTLSPVISEAKEKIYNIKNKLNEAVQ